MYPNDIFELICDFFVVVVTFIAGIKTCTSTVILKSVGHNMIAALEYWSKRTNDIYSGYMYKN